MNFTQAFFFVWLVSFLLFFTTLTVLRLGNSVVKNTFNIENEFQTVVRRIYFDMQLSISVALADAFFVGTVSDYYTDNTLAPAFGVQESTPHFEAMMKSGASTLSGFLISQILQNVIMKDSWLDPAEKEPVPDRKVPLLL